MELTSLYTAVITTIAVFGSAGAWRYYEKRVMAKEKAELAHKDDCRDRITKLEALLEHSGDEKDSMRKAILELTSEVSQLRVKVEYLTKDNETLRQSLSPKPPIKRRKYKPRQ